MAVGVYWGDGNPNNQSFICEAGPVTNQRTALFAAVSALINAHKLIKQGQLASKLTEPDTDRSVSDEDDDDNIDADEGSDSDSTQDDGSAGAYSSDQEDYEDNRPWLSKRIWRLIIKVASAYVVHAMTEWIFKWRANGLRNVRNADVTNRDLFELLDAATKQVEACGVQVIFHHVLVSRTQTPTAWPMQRSMRSVDARVGSLSHQVGCSSLDDGPNTVNPGHDTRNY